MISKKAKMKDTTPRMVNIPGGNGSDDDGSLGGYDTNDSILNGSSDDQGSHTSSLSVSSRDQDQSKRKSTKGNAGLAKRQDKTVKHLRFLLGSILVAVVGVAIIGYIHLQNTKQEQFEKEFKAQASKVIDGFKSDALNKLQSMEALSTSVTSYAMDLNLTWPFVRIQNSADYLEPYLALSGAASIVLMPIVGARQRTEWEEYSVEQSNWIDQDLQLAAHEDNNYGSMTHDGKSHRRRKMLSTEYYLSDEVKQYEQATAGGGSQHPDQDHRKTQYLVDNESSWESSISTYIKNYVGLDVSPGPWVVWWQYAPVIKDRWFVNFNRLAYEHFADDSQALLDGKAAVSRTRSFEPGLDFQSTRDFTFTNDLLTAGGNSDGYTPGEPIGYVYYPVFDNFHDNNKKVVSILMMTVYWKSYFQGKLSYR